MRRKILIHAGFHKTGTTAVQQFLRDNRQRIWPRAALALPHRLPEVLSDCLTYSRTGAPEALELVELGMRDFLRGLDLGRKRGLILSAENLSGRMPGRSDVDDYRMVPQLMNRLAKAVRAEIAGPLDICLLFTTRPPQDWLRSAWKHNLRAWRLCEGLGEFSGRVKDATNWQSTLLDISRAVPECWVREVPAEQCRNTPFGAAFPMLEFLGVPVDEQAHFAPIKRHNTGVSDDMAKQLLQLNRTVKSDKDLSTRKTTLLQQPEGTP